MKSANDRAMAAGMLAVFLLTLSAAPAQAQTLRWKFTKGQKLDYVMTQTSNISTTVMGRALDRKMTITMDTTWEVKSVESDGTASIGQKITRVRMKMEGGFFGKIEYDSDKKGGGGGIVADTFRKTFEPMINSETSMTITPRGEVKNLKFSDAMKAALNKAGPGNPAGGGISEDTFRQMTTQMGAFFPADPVTKGQTWSKKMTADLPFGKMETKTSMKYLGTTTIGGRKVAKIEVTPKMSLTPKPGAPIVFTMKFKGGSGISYFDIEKGVLTASDMTQNMEMQFTINGMTQVTTIKSEMQMRLKK